MQIVLEADYAMSLHPDEASALNRGVNEFWNWTGWKNRCWPADVVQPGLKYYKFDLNKRELCVLMEVDMGGPFTFSTMDEFADHVEGLIKQRPDPEKNNDSKKKWNQVKKRLSEQLNQGGRCTGICLYSRVLKSESIPLKGKFPQLGWCKLTEPNYGMSGV